ncbi:hypothetical protein [Chitinivibrio alkaliphilus]|uniref:Uncharacterized protein n=1 Tax=Chitinivibrio alkaliphilus ACht1 TaxID=1313304 RepID=U7D8I5_9BACT|nr:hypothetical protein [Chitinivibrio alkaliphilus]ERP31861.1 hypothetical protein CALK_1312 [Chitinivibrio alkaliphilus ACht1]
MDSQIFDSLDTIFREHRFQEGHRGLTALIETYLEQARPDEQSHLAEYLSIYEDALHNKDTVRLLDVLNYFIRPLLCTS